MLGHLAMSNIDLHRWVLDHLGDFMSEMLDGLDAVIQKEYLAVTIDLKQDGLADGFFGKSGDFGHHSPAVQRRCRQRTDVPQADHRHVQCSRDRRGGHGQDVDIDAEAFEALFVLDPKSLFFINDQQA